MSQLNLLHLICAIMLLFNFPAFARFQENLTGTPAFDDELSHEFRELLYTTDETQVDDLQEDIAEEVFNEPMIARAKVVELRLLLEDYIKQNGFTAKTKHRMKGLEKQINAEITEDRRQRLVGDAIFLTATVLTSASLYASLGMSELGTILDGAEEVEESATHGRHRLKSTYFYTQAMPSQLAMNTHAELTPAVILERDLVALGLKHDFVTQLHLEAVSPRVQGYTQFDRTNLPGLSYARIGHPARILFALTPSLFGNARAWLRTRVLNAKEISDVIHNLEQDSEHGGKEFEILVDPETREAFPTRLTAEQLRAHSKAWQQGFKYTYNSPWSDLRNRNDLNLFALEGRYQSARAKSGNETLSNSATP